VFSKVTNAIEEHSDEFSFEDDESVVISMKKEKEDEVVVIP
jgi:hypothetical protein